MLRTLTVIGARTLNERSSSAHRLQLDAAQHVTAFQGRRDAVLLDGGRLGEAQVGDSALQARVEVEIGKARQECTCSF